MLPSGLTTWGRATNGQLGHGRKQLTDVATPTAVAELKDRPLSSVACGNYHTVVVAQGEVFTCGRGALGLLGHGDEDDCLQPRPVKTLLSMGIAVKSVACGNYHTTALTDRGKVYAWGWRLESDPDQPGMVFESY